MGRTAGELHRTVTKQHIADELAMKAEAKLEFALTKPIDASAPAYAVSGRIRAYSNSAQWPDES
jgi:hypothetical protein